MRPAFDRALSTALAVLLLATAVHATWSIVIVDTRTGEVAVGTCTCLAGYDLRVFVPVIVVGRGAGAAQSYIDSTGQNRILMRNLILQGVDPTQILAALAAQDPTHYTRQYGIVDALGRMVTFSGSACGPWAGGVTGSIGTLVYAIQGNVLTGAPVIVQAEQAVRTTSGDIAAKLMAGMQAARAMGGDGRCSCSPSNPPGCGAPPPSFVYSSYIGCMIIARQGDTDGACNAAVGCAAGSYYLNFNVLNNTGTGPDPVVVLQNQFNAWRQTLVGRPDHHLSTVTFNPPSLVPNGTTQTTARVTLRDWQGTQLGGSNATVSVSLDPLSTAPATFGVVTPLGNGEYAFPVTAGTTAGNALVRVVVNAGQGPVLLSPRAVLPIRSDVLWASSAAFSAQLGASINFLIDAGPGHAGRTYVIGLSGSGSAPGIGVPPALNIPLNPDGLFFAALDFLNTPLLPNTFNSLDAAGRSTAGFVPPAVVLGSLANSSLTFAAALLNPVDFASNPVSIQVRP